MHTLRAHLANNLTFELKRPGFALIFASSSGKWGGGAKLHQDENLNRGHVEFSGWLASPANYFYPQRLEDCHHPQFDCQKNASEVLVGWGEQESSGKE